MSSCRLAILNIYCFGSIQWMAFQIFILFSVFQMRTFLQIWSQKNPVQELRIVPTNLEESLYPREQCVRQRQTWRYIYRESYKISINV